MQKRTCGSLLNGLRAVLNILSTPDCEMITQGVSSEWARKCRRKSAEKQNKGPVWPLPNTSGYIHHLNGWYSNSLESTEH